MSPTTALQPVIRPLRSGDVAALHLLAAHVSPRTLWLRFHAGCPEPPKEWLRRLSRCDRRLAALTAWEDGRVVGLVELVRGPDPDVADLAVLVADPWQWRGLGTRLVTAAADVARSRGAHTLIADVLAENRAAVCGLSRWAGHEVTREGPSLTYRLPLQSRCEA